VVPATLTFVPSNLPSGAASGSGDLVIATDCIVDGEMGVISCARNQPLPYAYALLTQADPDQSRVAVFSLSTLRIETTATVQVIGRYPVALVARDTIRVNGSLTASAGGFNARTGIGPGMGPGGGGGPTDLTGFSGGGGGFCGLGGPGGLTTGPGTNGGPHYGVAEIKPLIGGSSGGASDFGTSGAGGGALQLVAGTSIDVGLAGSFSSRLRRCGSPARLRPMVAAARHITPEERAENRTARPPSAPAPAPRMREESAPQPR
jgi:hypothetical protein